MHKCKCDSTVFVPSGRGDGTLECISCARPLTRETDRILEDGTVYSIVSDFRYGIRPAEYNMGMDKSLKSWIKKFEGLIK